MIHNKFRYILTLVALFAMTAGAWADDISVTTEDFGKVICTDGSIYATVEDATAASKTAAAKIFFIDNVNKKGLALALADESGTMDWSTAKTTAAAHTPAVTGGTWKLPTMEEWTNMREAAKNYQNDEHNGHSTFKNMANLTQRYWVNTEDEYDSNNAYYYISYSGGQYGFSIESKTNNNSCYVRACLEFNIASADGPEVTWNATTKQATFTMPASDVELQVEYFKEPGLAWKGKIPEGGFDAYLGFFHPSALPTIKNPNALTGITYSSSNTEVATVDENTGVVTALKAGSTVITATFAGDDTYEAAAISYTLNINSPAIVTLPTSTDEGGTVTLVAGAASEAHDGDNLIATNANLDGANTSRNIAVGDDGTIHVVYKNTESDAVMYKKSTDGITFSEPVQVSAESGTECEVAVSSNGKVYVSYTTTTGSGGYIAYSADGSSFTSVQVCSGYANSIHLAVDGDYVYGIPQKGTEFYYSADGGQNYATHTGWTGYMFSDVLIDKSNNNVVVIKDEPSVVVRYSTDHGATFTEEQPVMKDEQQLAVFFSTAAAGAGKVFISGADGMIATVNYINATYTQTTIEQTDNRSLCADEDENVIVGVEQNGSLYYELSTDGAQTFGEKVLVSEGSSANAALNHHDGSLLYLFTKGTDLYLATKTGVVSTETVIDNGDGTYTVMPGTEVTLIAKANDGYHVASWSNSVEVNDPQKATQTITVSGDLNISATFAENEYDITFAEGNPEPTKWTATPNPAKTSEKVNVKYTGERKVMGVRAAKKAAPKTLAEATLEDIGKIAGKDGKIYATKADAEAVATGNAVAMIAYVGTASDCAHGLAIALKDVSNEKLTWNNSGNNNESKTAAEWCSAWNTSKAVTGGTWRLPSISDWQYMFIGCGASESYSDNPIQMSYSGLASKLTTAQGDALPVNDDYWSSTVASPDYPWTVLFGDSYAFFGNNTWEGHAFDLVRACLAF